MVVMLRMIQTSFKNLVREGRTEYKSNVEYYFVLLMRSSVLLPNKSVHFIYPNKAGILSRSD